MKALRPITLALAVALVAVPGLIFAQGFSGGPGRGGPGGMHGPGNLDFLLGFVGDVIGLSDEQRAQIEAILDEGRPAIQELREQAREAGQQFRDSQQPGQFDEDAVRAFAGTQAQLRTDIMVETMRLKSQVFSVLTPEQQTQLQEMRERRQERCEQRGNRRGGGKRGGGWSR